jgi:hypothetical protein
MDVPQQFLSGIEAVKQGGNMALRRVFSLFGRQKGEDRNGN